VSLGYGRALYSGSNGRGLYSGMTGRALYNPLQWNTYQLIDSTHSGSDFEYEVEKASGVKSDVWPEVKNHQDAAWGSGFTGLLAAYAQWYNYSDPNKVYGEAQVAAGVFDVSAKSGSKCYGVRFDVQYISIPSGAGAPMVSVQTQASATPSNGYSWLEGTERVEVTSTGTAELWFTSPITLADYLFVVAYIDGLEPATAEGVNALFRLELRYPYGVSIFV